MTSPDAAPIRVGVIGCGVIAYWVHLRLLQKMKNVKLVVASDPEPAARERAARIAPVPIVERAEEILADPAVDAVVICAPTHLHADLAASALEAGKHVFVEKPIATNAHDSQRLLAIAQRSSLSAMVGFNRRLHPLFEQARRLIASGAIGAVHAVQSANCEPMIVEGMSEWRRRRETGGGVLLDLASHHVDLARWFLDDEVESVECSLASRETEDDTATLSLSMRKGAAIQSFFSFRTARADYLQFICERGTLLIDRHQPKFTVRVARRLGYGTRRQLVMPDAPVALWRAQRLARPSKEPSYQRALAAFADSIRGGPGKVASMADGARSLEVILAAEDSARSRTQIRLPT